MSKELTVIDETRQDAGIGPVMPVATPQQMHNAMVLYEELKKSVLDTRTDYQAADGKRFIKKSGWAKLAIAFGVSTEITGEHETRDEEGNLLRARYKVRATAPNGRYAEGIGVCSVTESRFAKNQKKVEHDLPATAETRARNRAYSALFGHGEVSYEEVELSDGGSGGFEIPDVTGALRDRLRTVAKEYAQQEGEGRSGLDVIEDRARELEIDFTGLDQLSADQMTRLGKAIKEKEHAIVRI